MYNTNNRLNKCLEEMTENEKYELMKSLEDENSIHLQENTCNIVEPLVNVLLEVTTVIVKIFGII